MPSFFIFHCRVERLIPRRDAAPCGPQTTQPVSRRDLMVEATLDRRLVVESLLGGD
jgi:hypothetical protein